MHNIYYKKGWYAFKSKKLTASYDIKCKISSKGVVYLVEFSETLSSAVSFRTFVGVGGWSYKENLYFTLSSPSV